MHQSSFLVINGLERAFRGICGSSFDPIASISMLDHRMCSRRAATRGTYTSVASGSTDNGASEIGTFSLSGSFQVTCATGVPQFPFGLAALFAVMVPMVLVLKKRASFSSSAA